MMTKALTGCSVHNLHSSTGHADILLLLITKVLTIPPYTSTSGLCLASLHFPIQFSQDPSLSFSWTVDLAL